MANFNSTHPERQKGEVFIVNTTASLFIQSGKSSQGYRLGKVAYTNTGKVVEGYVPMFGKSFYLKT